MDKVLLFYVYQFWNSCKTCNLLSNHDRMPTPLAYLYLFDMMTFVFGSLCLQKCFSSFNIEIGLRISFYYGFLVGVSCWWLAGTNLSSTSFFSLNVYDGWATVKALYRTSFSLLQRTNFNSMFFMYNTQRSKTTVWLSSFIINVVVLHCLSKYRLENRKMR